VVAQAPLTFVFHLTLLGFWIRVYAQSPTMADTKEHVQMKSSTKPGDDRSPVNEDASLKQGTATDQLDMQRLGKTQQTKVLLTIASR